MNKKLAILGFTALLGIALFAFEMWGQPAPVSRDPDIGAGLLGLLGIAIAAFGILGFILESVKSLKNRR